MTSRVPQRSEERGERGPSRAHTFPVAATPPQRPRPEPELCTPAELTTRVTVCTTCPHRNLPETCACRGLCAHPSVLSPSLAPQPARRSARCPAGRWPSLD